MFIQTEDTPNPATLKFLPGRTVLGTADGRAYVAGDDVSESPLAQRLLQVAGVTSVYLGGDFISITKNDTVDWYVLKPALLGIIMEHFLGDVPVVYGLDTGEGEPAQEEPSLWRQIREIIDTRVRPAVAQDGGDIRFERFEEGVVYVRMFGACAGCPSSTATLKSGIENMLRYYVPEVTEVRQIA